MSQPDLFAPAPAPVPSPIPAGWADLPFFAEDFPRIAAALAQDGRLILPPHERRFHALILTPPDAVKVVILGQDPYPTPGHAMGLAFSINPDVRPLAASLKNIFKELADDTGDRLPNGDLSGWARQGVLLLNTHLSVPAGQPAGHARLGWERLTAQVLDRVSQRPTAFLLWGRPAQAQRKHIQPGDHLILESVHPSPLSASRGFFGTKPFSRVNEWLQARGEAPIDWSAPGS